MKSSAVSRRKGAIINELRCALDDDGCDGGVLNERGCQVCQHEDQCYCHVNGRGSRHFDGPWLLDPLLGLQDRDGNPGGLPLTGLWASFFRLYILHALFLGRFLNATFTGRRTLLLVAHLGQHSELLLQQRAAKCTPNCKHSQLHGRRHLPQLPLASRPQPAR